MNNIKLSKYFFEFFAMVFFVMMSIKESIAQTTQTNDIEMADAMRANGKIYIVVGGLSVIFIGLVVYLVRLDNRISKLEKKNK